MSLQLFQLVKTRIFPSPKSTNIATFFCLGFLLVNLILDENTLPLNILING